MKAYTDINQSKKLAKILPIESADMAFIPSAYDDKGDYLYTAEIRSEILLQEDDEWIPCWSFAALFEILPHIQEFYPILAKINDKYVCRYKNSCISVCTDNPIDACYEMIINLHEQNLL